MAAVSSMVEIMLLLRPLWGGGGLCSGLVLLHSPLCLFYINSNSAEEERELFASTGVSFLYVLQCLFLTMPKVCL